MLGWVRVIRLARLPSYFPELKRKPYFSRLTDHLKWIVKNKEINSFYCLYGLDLLGKDCADEYLDYTHFANSRDDGNLLDARDSQVSVLRDKLLFHYYSKACNIDSPEVIAVINDGMLTMNGITTENWSRLENERDYFCKSATGECASYVVHIADYDDLCGKRSEISKDCFILQKRVIQHPELGKLNPHAINTIRIVTAMRKGQVHVLSALLRVGTSKTGDVDNWARGGLAIGLNENGTLREYGFYKPAYAISGKPKESEHPDTGVVFKDFQVPFFDETRELVMRAHRCLNRIQTIGWDVAITQNGPVIIEGNDNWEISLMQACNGGLRKEWQQLQLS